MDETETEEYQEPLDWKSLLFRHIDRVGTFIGMGEDGLVKWMIGIDHLESLIKDVLEKEIQYTQILNQKLEELNKKYGKNPIIETQKMREFYAFKLSEIVKLFKKHAPIDVKGRI